MMRKSYRKILFLRKCLWEFRKVFENMYNLLTNTLVRCNKFVEISFIIGREEQISS